MISENFLMDGLETRPDKNLITTTLARANLKFRLHFWLWEFLMDSGQVPPSSSTKREERFLKMKTRLDIKLALMGASCVFITAVALVILAVWQSGQYNALAQNEVDGLINTDLDHIARSVYNLVQAENEAVQLQVDDDLNVARHLLKTAGEVRLSKDTVGWTAVNQFTGASIDVRLPKLLINNTWLGKNTELSVKTPVVDDVTRLVGETATIFQRMNDRGDMLRVATTVQTTSNKRAIGTYIPAVNPDGSNNPVVSAILQDKPYHGRAYVVNAWYLTAYEPLKDSAGNLVGMLYVGIKQKAVEARVRQAILQTQIGKTGYVYVLEGGGQNRGRYIISYKGERDGENIWSIRDSDGRYIAQDIIKEAKTLQKNEMFTMRYRWKNQGEKEARWKIVRITYYAPWDWVIGAGAYEDELQTYRTLLEDGRIRMIRAMGLAGILITALVGLIGILLTWRITRPVRQMTRVAEKIIAGDMNQVVDEMSHDEIGVLAHTFNLMTDQINQSMENLRKSEEKYREIFENALEGLFQISMEGRFLSVNPAMAHILGYDSAEELVERMTDIKNELLVDAKASDKLNAIMADQGDVSGFELQIYRKDRVKIWVATSARLVHDDTGNPDYIEGFVTDISRRKKAEEEKLQLESRLTQAQKMESIGTLAGGIAHDFNNILSAIIGFTELAVMDIDQKEKVLKALKQVHKAGIRAKELVKQILTFSRMTETEYAPIALKYIISDSLKMLRSVIPSTIEIKSTLSVDGLVMSDATQIHQIMMNLCTNAVHAMDEKGGILDIRLQDVSIDTMKDSKDLDLAPGPYVLLSIRDTGAGIPPDVMDRIFEPYFTTKKPGRGTGLGLSVIHGIVKSHSGAIKCKSILQKGTTFDVYLPRIETDQTPLEPPEQTPFPTGHERILFVDDEKELANLAVDILERMGFHVIAKTSSVEALSLFRDNPDEFDLVITDMTMPGVTGDRLAMEMIRIRQDIPIILCTGYNEHFSEQNARKIGIKEFIMKPLDIRTLAETIRKTLDSNKNQSP